VKRHSAITVATYQSVYTADQNEFCTYDVVLFDEAHHIAADTLYEVSYKKISNAVHRIGLSADIERQDGATILVEAAAGPIIYSYPAPKAIAEGWLAKPTFQIYEVWTTKGTWVTWREVKGKREAFKVNDSEPVDTEDHMKAFKNWIIGNNKLTDTVSAIAAEMVKDGKNVLILIDEKEHGEKFVENFRNLKVEAEYVYGGREDSQRVVRLFNERKLKLIVATSTLGEGADTVSVDVLINLMGGTRPKQAIGRALRNDPDPITGIPRKPTCLIIDFDFPNSPVLNRHSEMREEVYRTYGDVHRSKLL
jgi:superfamily II DNA or RNA helicase